MATQVNIGDTWKDIVVAAIEEANGENMKVKVIDIGDWDMDADLNLIVAHGLDITKIRSIDVLIRNDDDTNLKPLYHNLDSDSCKGGFICTATDISMHRTPGEGFDHTDYSDSGNRGWITIWYVV